jgi:Ycf66 protein N-terminus
MNLSSILGLIYIILSVLYFIASIILVTRKVNKQTSSNLVLYVLQAILVPILLLSCGVILFFQGWRLDPILLMQQLLVFILITYFAAKDIGNKWDE